MTELRKKLILRRIEQNAISGDDLAKKLESTRDVQVLDKNEVMALIEGEATTLDKIAGVVGLNGWTAFPFKSIPKPDVRPKVLKSPSSMKIKKSIV